MHMTPVFIQRLFVPPGVIRLVDDAYGFRLAYKGSIRFSLTDRSARAQAASHA